MESYYHTRDYDNKESLLGPTRRYLSIGEGVADLGMRQPASFYTVVPPLEPTPAHTPSTTRDGATAGTYNLGKWFYSIC